ncbi:hypothetical protein D3C81_2038440 [compost metagenome]
MQLICDQDTDCAHIDHAFDGGLIDANCSLYSLDLLSCEVAAYLLDYCLEAHLGISL